MRYRFPEILYLFIPWVLFCLVILINQAIALRWVRENISARFRANFTRYTESKLWLHIFLIFSMGACLIWTVAGPYGHGDVKEEGTVKNIFLIIDSSYSMYAADTQSLSLTELRGQPRFDIAKRVAIDFANADKVDKIGLITFSGTSVTHFLPTLDRLAVTSVLNGLHAHSMRHTGSDFLMPLKDIVHAVHNRAGQYVGLILSDGEPLPAEQNPDDILAALNAADIPIFTVGLGSDTGGEVNLFDPEDLFNNVENPKVAKTITSKRNGDFLRHIAQATHGEYFEMEDGVWTDTVASHIADLPLTNTGGGSDENRVGTVDYSPFGLTVFLLLFFGEFVYLFPQKRSFVVLVFLISQCRCNNRLFLAHQENETGIDRYEVSLFDHARSHFETSVLYRTKEEIPLLNLGDNSILEKEYNTAHGYFQQAMRTDPAHPDAFFNDGVALFLWAEDEVDPKGCFLAKSAELYDQAIVRFEDANKKGGEGQKNIDYIKKRINDLYKLHYAAKDCQPPSSNNSYTSKFAPPPPPNSQNNQGQNQQQQSQQNNQNQNKNQQQDQNQPQQQGKNQNQSNPQQQPQQDQNSVGSGLNEAEQKSVDDNLDRIKNDSANAKDFKQSKDEQRPTDKSEVDQDLYW